MEGYLGEESVVSLEGTPFERFTPKDWALHYIGCYGSIDGAHHKTWVLDQVARILHGTLVLVKLARWDNGHTELRFETDDPSAEYLAWVVEQRGEYDEESGLCEYDYDEGIAP